MSRKDTIIIAVLVNVGLLIVLFATSISSQSEPTLATVAPPAPPVEAEVAYSSPALPARITAPSDEVDQVLTQYANPVQKTEIAVSSTAPEIVTSAPKIEQEVAVQREEPVQVVKEAPVVQKPEIAFVEVTVKKGDVLEKIARIHHCTIDEIMKANRLPNSRLRIGQVLKVPSKGAVRKEALATKTGETAKSVESVPGGKYYIVKPGDNPWTIAVKNHMKVEELLKLNDLTQQQARHLKPGDKLRIK